MRRSEIPDIPGYDVKHELGAGGMATVFLAIQKSLDRKVAIKILKTTHDDNPEQTERRFLREGRTLAKITHRNVCGIYDIAKIGDIAYIAMEFLDGGTLVDKLKDGMSVGEAIAVTVQVASALQEAHAQGIIHRDLKPANVMMRGGKIPVLTDFGIARELTATQTKITTENMIVGTPAYMSPEQVSGGEVDGSSDVYSLGIMLFELLTGQVPYRGDSPIAVCMQHLTAPLPKLPPALSELQPILDRMLAKKREDRFNSMQEFTFALRNAFVASNTLRSVMQFAPDQPWSEQLRNLGFTFDTIRDSDIKAALDAQKAQARAARAAAGSRDAVAESVRAPMVQATQPRPAWIVPLLMVIILSICGGIAYWFIDKGPSALEELALQQLKTNFEVYLKDNKLYGSGSDNAAAVLEQMRSISRRATQTKQSENFLWQSTEKAARAAVESGKTEGIQDLINQAGATFDSERLQTLANELNSKLEETANKERSTRAISQLRDVLKSGADFDDAVLQVRQLVPASDPQRAQVEAEVETKLAGQVAMALQQGDLPGAQTAVGKWRALFPESKLALSNRDKIQGLLAKLSLKDSITALSARLDQQPFDVATVSVVASELKRLRLEPQAATEKDALGRIEQGLLTRIEREVTASAETDPNRVEQLLQVATAELPASPGLARLQQKVSDARSRVAAKEAEAKALALRGTLAIDAVPWARVKSVRSKDGNASLPANPVTPLVLTLTEGSYQLELVDASGNQRTQTALVARQQRAQVKVDFRSATSEEYLREAGY